MSKYKAVCGADFDHCEKGRCSNCNTTQRHKCEVEVSKSISSKSK